MADNIDPYALCPCGSGKKIKFCCQDVATEMSRIVRMNQTGQTELARQMLAALAVKPHPGAWTRSWIKGVQFVTHPDHYSEEAQGYLRESLKENPLNPLSTVMEATRLMQEQGFPAAQAAFEQALIANKGRRTEPLGALAQWIVRHLLGEGAVSASIRFGEIAAGHIPEDKVEDYQESLRNRQFSYIARVGFTPRQLPEPSTQSEQYASAGELLAVGASAQAAKLFDAIAHAEPAPANWINAGIAHAWGCEHKQAVAAFRKAAALARDSNFDLAVEAETLAQQVEIEVLLPRAMASSGRYTVKDLEQTKERLATQPRLHPLREMPGAAAQFLLLDRPADPPSSLSLAELPRVLGVVVLTVAGVLVIEVGPGTDLTMCENAVADMLGYELLPLDEIEENPNGAAERQPLSPNRYFLNHLTISQQKTVEKSEFHEVVDQVWPHMKLSALGGKTPREAAGVPELRVALAAAIFQLDAHCSRLGNALDVELIRSRFGLPPAEIIELPAGQSLETVTALELLRLDLSSLDDDAIMRVMQFSVDFGHDMFTSRVTMDVLGRPKLLEKGMPSQLHLQLARLSVQRFSYEEALAWLQRGKRELEADREADLNDRLGFELDEFMIRSQIPNDPQLPKVAEHLWNFYARKIPQVRQQVIGLLLRSGLPGPWENPSLLVGGEFPLAGSQLWTPELEREPSASSPTATKLWVPGQS